MNSINRTLAALNPASDDFQVFRLRYMAYTRDKSIEENDAEIFMDEYDGLENCKSYLYCQGDQPVASIRSCFCNSIEEGQKVPAMEVFGSDIRRTIGGESKFVESNKFVIHPDFQNLGRRIMVPLFTFIFSEAMRTGADYVITAVRPAHAAFYKQMSFSPISQEMSYPHLSFKTVLLASNVSDAQSSTSPLLRRIFKNAVH